MVTHPDYPENPPRNYSPDEISTRLDTLTAEIDRAEERIAELQPEPLTIEELEAHYLEMFADVTAATRHAMARTEGGE